MFDDSLLTPFAKRAIYLTSDKQEIKFEDLRGTCVALHPESIPDRALDNFKTTPNSFRIIGQTTSQRITSIERLEILSKDEVPKCEVCSRAWLHALDLEREWKERKRLKGLALYSSGGGIELGLLASGYVDTRYAVDFSPSACHTFRYVLFLLIPNFLFTDAVDSAHHSAAVVYNQCGNLLLEAKVNQRQNLKALYHNEDLPPLPNIGEIDLITCGPSCQGFSGLNRYKSHDDVRNTLMANAMSYVEFYKPKYFMVSVELVY
jgi:DNA (cytosine-5)-methyltransferase 1